MGTRRVKESHHASLTMADVLMSVYQLAMTTTHAHVQMVLNSILISNLARKCTHVSGSQMEAVSKYARRTVMKQIVVARRITRWMRTNRHVQKSTHVTETPKEVANSYVRRREMKLCVVVKKDSRCQLITYP